MDQSRYIKLLQKKQNQGLSAAEAEELTRLESQDQHAELGKIWEAVDSYKTDFQPDVEAGLARFKAKLKAEEQEAPVVHLPAKNRRFFITRIAAAVVLLIGVAFAIQYFSGTTVPMVAMETQSDVLRSVEMPDGSTIWLNRASSLEYPESFAGSERRVVLKGEAFFDVVRNEEKPFIVQTDAGEVQVLGTSFNVRAYPGEDFEEVQVVSGKVAYNPSAVSQKTELVAGQWSKYEKKAKRLTPDNNADPNRLAWKTGKAVFETTPMRKILETMEHMYGLKFNVQNLNPILDCPFTISLEGLSAEEAVRTMQLAFHLETEKIANNTYRLIGGSCN